MTQTIVIDGQEYDASFLSDEGQRILASYILANQQLEEANKMMTILNRAKNSYISELKSEMVQGKTGLDLSSLLSEE